MHAHPAFARLALTLVASLSLAACGGSGSGSSTPPLAEQQVTLGSQATLDGYVGTSRNTINNDGLHLGDWENGDDAGYRAFVSFDVSTLPVGATIKRATLRLYQWNQVGTPYQSHGVVVVDHLDYGDALDGDDYGAAALSSNIGTLSSDVAQEYKELDVTAQIQADRSAARTRTQYRLRFSLIEKNNDGEIQVTRFECADDAYGTHELPQLVVTYTLP